MLPYTFEDSYSYLIFSNSNVDSASQEMYTYVGTHEKTRIKSQILENELSVDFEITAISRQIAFHFKRLTLLVGSQSRFL